MTKKILFMIASFFMVTLLGVGLYVGTIAWQATGNLQKTFKGFGDENDVIAATKPMTILLMGVDTGKGDSRKEQWEGNSDTMLLLTVNPKTKETTMMSLLMIQIIRTHTLRNIQIFFSSVKHKRRNVFIKTNEICINK